MGQANGERKMASERFEAIVEDFEFLEDWEDRYRYVIDQGKALFELHSLLPLKMKWEFNTSMFG